MKRRIVNRIRIVRKQAGLSQQQLADLINANKSSVSRYERQDQRVDLILLRRLVKALDCDVAELISEPGPMPLGDPTEQAIYLFRRLSSADQNMFLAFMAQRLNKT